MLELQSLLTAQAHHDWKAPIAAATAYGHPVDFFLHCVLAVSLGPVVVRSHLSTAWVWYLVITSHELNDHSGYHLPWLRSSQAHDYHHRSQSSHLQAEIIL